MQVNAVGLHLHPKHWGNMPTQWDPKRWIVGSGYEKESLMKPVEGSYLPWSEGPRGCPGRKFSQVEFVAVIATLFQHHTVKVAHHGSEKPEAARSRLARTIDESSMFGFTYRMDKPQACALIWTKADFQYQA